MRVGRSVAVFRRTAAATETNLSILNAAAAGYKGELQKMLWLFRTVFLHTALKQHWNAEALTTNLFCGFGLNEFCS